MGMAFMKTNYITAIHFLIIAALLTGCTASIPVKDGTDISPDEMAVIVDSYWGSFRYSKAGIWGVDGTDLNFKERVTVPPGKHSVLIYCARGYFLGSQLNAVTLSQEFTAEPGHKYRVMCSAENGIYYTWIVDLTSNRTVAGQQP